jgi:uncharacterized protein (TIGR03435 family)
MKRISALAALTMLLGAGAWGQTPASPTFDLADVHASPPSSAPFMNVGVMGSRNEVRNATMVDLIALAYGMDNDAVIGGPSWLQTDRFDIIGKTSARASEADRNLMMQALLADRFKLVVHKDNRPQDAFVLTAGKKVLLKESGGAGVGVCQPPTQTNGSGPQPYIVLECKHMTMDEFATQFHQMAGGYVTHPMLNLTHIEGSYDFTIKWTPRGQLRPPTPGETDPNPGISFFEAVDRQLGLKLVPDKRPMPAIVVDSVNRTPTENAPGISKSLPAAPTEFEAASIKPNKTGSQNRRIQPKAGGAIEVENISVKELIGLAWNMDRDDDRIVGGPKWIESEAFDIIAKTSEFPPNVPPPFDAVRVMMQSLLKERFKVAVHTEEQPVAVWTLVVAKGGVKMKEADPEGRPGCTPSQGDATSAGIPMLNLVCKHTKMSELTEQIRNFAGGYVDHPAMDMTGLNTAYDFTIKWTPRGAYDAAAARGAGDAAADPTGAISFFDAVEKQLGVRFEGGQKRPYTVLVIDHVEQPSEN